MSRVSATLVRHRLAAATAATAAAVIVVGGAFAVTAAHGSTQVQLTGNGKTGSGTTVTATKAPTQPLTLLSATPAGGTHDADGGAKITLTFSAPLSPSTPLPTLSPKIAGKWKVSGGTATFTPASGFTPDTKVTLKIPGGKNGMAAAAAAGTLKHSATVKYETGNYSTLRLQQILAQLGYLPLTWTPTGLARSSTGPALNTQVTDAYRPPAGTFAVKPGYPAELTSQWHVGTANMLDQGAIMAFESNQNLTLDGIAGPTVWSHLLAAAAQHKVNPNGYTYALASQASPETLTVWHDGKVIEHTLANTGVAGAGTADGTYPVYLRYQANWMNGTNSDGSTYHDYIYWISYFNGGDAVHYYDRASYGYYQSNGCVEVPLAPAKLVWGYMTYGTLVTVTGPES